MNDNSIMTFGKHKDKKLIDVPASYWLWLEEQDWFEEEYPAYFDYMQDNMEAIEQEANYDEW